MYSWELRDFFNRRNNVISREDYDLFINKENLPQMTYLKYNPYDNEFCLITQDDYCFNFTIKE